MATTSVISAVKSKFDSLTASDFPGAVRPPLYFGEAPPVNGAGAQVQATTAGYVVFTHAGTPRRPYAFGGYTREDATIDFVAYYPSLADCEKAKQAIQKGFDYGTLPDLDASFFQKLTIRPMRDQAGYESLGQNGTRVHQWTVSFRVEIVRNPT